MAKTQPGGASGLGKPAADVWQRAHTPTAHWQWWECSGERVRAYGVYFVVSRSIASMAGRSRSEVRDFVLLQESTMKMRTNEALRPKSLLTDLLSWLQ